MEFRLCEIYSGYLRCIQTICDISNIQYFRLCKIYVDFIYSDYVEYIIQTIKDIFKLHKTYLNCIRRISIAINVICFKKFKTPNKNKYRI